MVQFERNQTRMIVNPSTEVELQHEDRIALVAGVYVKWVSSYSSVVFRILYCVYYNMKSLLAPAMRFHPAKDTILLVPRMCSYRYVTDASSPMYPRSKPTSSLTPKA